MQTLLQRAGQDEQGARAQPMSQHRHDGSVKRVLIPGKDSQQHEAQMGNAAVGDEPFEVGLRERQDRSV